MGGHGECFFFNRVELSQGNFLEWESCHPAGRGVPVVFIFDTDVTEAREDFEGECETLSASEGSVQLAGNFLAHAIDGGVTFAILTPNRTRTQRCMKNHWRFDDGILHDVLADIGPASQ